MKSKIKEFLKSVLAKFNFVLYRKVNNKKFKIPIIKNIGYNNIFLEGGLWKSDIFIKFLPIKEGLVIDIGVNTGQTLLELRSVNDQIKYIGFEPNPFCIFYLNNLIIRNNIVNSIIVPVGIYNESKIVHFDLMGESDSGASIIEDLRPGYNSTPRSYVPVFKFDDVAKYLDLSSLLIVKIDVEGAELEVLESMKSVLIMERPVVLCEILWAHNQDKLRHFEDKVEKLFRLLLEINYSLFQIIKSKDMNNVKSLRKLTQIKAEAYRQDNKDECDYLLVHQKNEGELPYHLTE